jgi:DNA-binding SARP family transcriptional activator
MVVRIFLLGGFTVSVDGATIDEPWRLRKAETLVKLLALAPAHRARREVLCEQLWLTSIQPRQQTICTRSCTRRAGSRGAGTR